MYVLSILSVSANVEVGESEPEVLQESEVAQQTYEEYSDNASTSADSISTSGSAHANVPVPGKRNKRAVTEKQQINVSVNGICQRTLICQCQGPSCKRPIAMFSYPIQLTSDLIFGVRQWK